MSLNQSISLNGHVEVKPFYKKNGKIHFAEATFQKNMVVALGRKFIFQFLKGDSSVSGKYIKYIAFGSGGTTPSDLSLENLVERKTNNLEVFPADETDHTKIVFVYLLTSQNFSANATINEAGLFLNGTEPELFSRVTFNPVALSASGDIFTGLEIRWTLQF